MPVLSQKQLTFEDLAIQEPRLLCLLRLAKQLKSVHRKKNFCGNMLWYKDFKPLLEGLVGYYASNPELQNSEAYDLAYGTIYQALPDCKDCKCI